MGWLTTIKCDIEVVFGGLITAAPQGQLSHPAIRLARQGTPNAYVRDALEAFRKSYSLREDFGPRC